MQKSSSEYYFGNFKLAIMQNAIADLVWHHFLQTFF